MDMNGNGGFDGSWVVILFLAIMFGGFGGCGIGGRGGCDSGEYGRAEHQHMDTREEIRFNEAATQAAINNLGATQYQQAIFAEICGVNRNVDGVNFNVLLQGKDNQLATLQSEKAINDKIDANTIRALELQGMRDYMDKSILGMQYAMLDRCCPRPAWPTCNPMASSGVNVPFGGGCGGF